MAKGKVISSINHDGTAYKKGQTIEADKKVIDTLIEAGAVEDPDTPQVKEESNQDVEAAQVKADKLVKDAEKTLADAKAEAEKITAKAIEDADKVVADAKAEAEKIVSEAKSKK